MISFLRRLWQRPAQQEAQAPKDEWLFGQKHVGGNVRWFAFSTAAHVLLLSVLATLTISSIQKKQELIKVKTLSLPEETLAEEELEDWEGEPSLKDIPGILSLEVAPATKAKPPPRAGRRVEAVRVAALPVMTGVGPTMTIGRMDDLSTQLSNLSGAIDGIGGDFGDEIGGLRKVGLDVVLVIDSTDSMQFVIDSAKTHLEKLVVSLRTMVPISRIGVVAYRDRGEEYLTKWVDLSFSTSKIQGFLVNLTSGGGGDWPEAVFDGMDVAIRDLTWRKKSKRIIVLVPGSPPHPDTLAQIQNVSSGFRSQGGFISVVDLAEKMHEDFHKKITRYHQKPSPVPPLPSFYRGMQDTLASVARAGGGEFIPLIEEKALIRQIIVLTFGTRWKVEMAKYLRDLE
jgi:hypothetical protein